MKVGSFRTLCAAAVAGAMAVPAMAQNTGTPTAEGGTRQAPNGARGAEGEAGTVRPNAGRAQPGATLRPTAPAAGTIVEEQPGQPGTRTANFPPQNERQGRQADGQQGQGQARLGDAALVRWIGADNEAEVRISEVAQQKAQNEQVKQFAKMMVDEHTKLGEKLQKVSGHHGDAAEHSATTEERSTTRRNANANENARDNVRGAAENRNEGRDAAARGDRKEAGDEARDANADAQGARNNDRNANRNTTRTETETHTAGGNMRGGNNPAISLHEQIKQECVASFTKELQSKSGAEFDKCYLGGQIMAHMGMIDTLKVADQYASADLKQTLQQARKSTEQHLQKAKELMKQIENERQ